MLKRLVVFLGIASVAAAVGLKTAIERSDEEARQNPTHPENPNHKAGQELSDMSARVLVSLAITMILFAIVMHFGIAQAFIYLRHRMTQTEPRNTDASLLSSRLPPPQPRLQRNPPEDLRYYRDHQRQLLKTYGWVDKKAGKVRVPIDEAMEILLHKK